MILFRPRCYSVRRLPLGLLICRAFSFFNTKQRFAARLLCGDFPGGFLCLGWFHFFFPQIPGMAGLSSEWCSSRVRRERVLLDPRFLTTAAGMEFFFFLDGPLLFFPSPFCRFPLQTETSVSLYCKGSGAEILSVGQVFFYNFLFLESRFPSPLPPLEEKYLSFFPSKLIYRFGFF